MKEFNPIYPEMEPKFKKIPPYPIHPEAELPLDKPFVEIQSLDFLEMSDAVGNLYKMVAIFGKRADQINAERHKKLHEELKRYKDRPSDPLIEVEDTPDQEKVVKRFEKLAKPPLQAIFEYLRGELEYKEKSVIDDINA